MKQYKAENNINKSETRKKEERQLPARQEREGSVANKRAAGTNSSGDNTFTTAAGYTMEKGAYNTKSKEAYENHKTNHPGSGMAGMAPDNASFDADGYLSYDSTKPQWQANDLLKEAGYKVGDMLWKPGAKDDLNGRELTGRIARITENGNYIPEYVNDAINSSHRSTGNAGYAGEVGLGADQAAYNRQYEKNNDVTTGQVNQQREANGLDPVQQEQPQAAGTGQSQSYQSQPSEYGVQPQTQSQGSQNSSGGSGFNREYASFNYQPNASQYGSQQFDFKSNNTKSLNLDFSFNPNKFNQGQ